MSTEQITVTRAKYPSDLTDKQWGLLENQLPQPKNQTSKGGRPSENLREIVNGILYVVKSSCQWRNLPHDFPKWPTVYSYFNKWSKSGLWESLNIYFVKKLRLQMGRDERAGAGSIDSQSVKTTAVGGRNIGFDAGKTVKGRKRFILIDTQGLLLVVWICAAAISEKKGAMYLLRHAKMMPHLRQICSRLALIWVDAGYQGEALADYVKKLWGWVWQVVKRPKDQVGFVVLARRWVVERTFAWIINARRLDKDYERNRKNSQSMVYLAMLTIMLRRIK